MARNNGVRTLPQPLNSQNRGIYGDVLRGKEALGV